MPVLTTKTGIPLGPGASIGPDINALLGGIVDRKKWYFYDTLKFPPGYQTVTGEYEFFRNPSGVSDPYNANAIKTQLETNLLGQGGQFANPYDMVLTNLGFYFASDNRLYDINQVVKYGYFQFSIFEKVHFKGHLWRHPPGAGLTGMSTQGTESVWNNGVPKPESIYYFGQWSKYIPPLVPFRLTLQFFQTVGVAMSGTNGGTLGANAVAAGQSGSALPTLLAANQGGNGVWLVGFMNGLSDGPVS